MGGVATGEARRDAEVAPVRGVPGPVPTFRGWTDSGSIDGRTVVRLVKNWAKQLEPNEAGTLWLAIFVLLVVAFDIRRPLSSRNAELILLVLPAFFLLDLVELGNLRIGEPGNAWWFQTMFLGLFLATVALLVRSLAGVFLPERPAWAPNLPHRLLVWLALVLFAGNAMLALGRRPTSRPSFLARHLLEDQRFTSEKSTVPRVPGAVKVQFCGNFGTKSKVLDGRSGAFTFSAFGLFGIPKPSRAR